MKVERSTAVFCSTLYAGQIKYISSAFRLFQIYIRERDVVGRETASNFEIKY